MKINITLLGGGPFLLRACEWLAKQEFVDQLTVITAPRHAEENVENAGIDFRDFVIKISENNKSIGRVSIVVTDTLDSSQVANILSESDIAFSFSAAWIFKKVHIDFCENFLNMHCTTLPQWRGGGGLSWQILAGERRSAVTFHKINAGVDTGDIVLNQVFYFPDGVNTPKQRSDYIYKLAWPAFKGLISDFVSDASLPKARAQDESFSSYFPRLNSSVQACINWSWSPREIVQFVTAFDDPYPGAFSYLVSDNAKIFLKKATILTGEPDFHPFQAGIIYRINPNGLHVCARGGALLIREVFDESGSSVLDKLKVGDRIHTPQTDLDLAMSVRVMYTPQGLKK